MTTLEILQEMLIKEWSLSPAQVEAGTPMSALGIDSLDFIDFLFKIEDRFALQIKDDIPTSLVTLNDVVQYVDSLIAKQAKSSEVAAVQIAAID